MHTITHEYETIFVVEPELAEDTLGSLNEKLGDVIDSNGGQLLFVDDWGKRKLAYPIRKHQRGHYVYLRLLGPGSLIEELERHMRITDTIMRFLTVRIGEDVDVAEATEAAAEIKKKMDEEAAKRAAEEAARAAERAAYEEYERQAAEEAARKAAAKAAAAAEAEAESEGDAPAADEEVDG